jgi:hypothetical protein
MNVPFDVPRTACRSWYLVRGTSVHDTWSCTTPVPGTWHMTARHLTCSSHGFSHASPLSVRAQACENSSHERAFMTSRHGMEFVTTCQVSTPDRAAGQPDVRSGHSGGKERPMTNVRNSGPIAIPNQRCRAKNRRGEPCKAWCVRGAVVCIAHGGGAPQVRAAAQRRLTASQARAEMDRAMARYSADLRAWQARRVALTASLMDIPPERVTWSVILACRVLHGRPDERRPEITDERYRPPRGIVLRGEVIKEPEAE